MRGRRFGCQPGELASFNIVLTMRRRERDAEEAASRVREKLAAARARGERRRAWARRVWARMGGGEG